MVHRGKALYKQTITLGEELNVVRKENLGFLDCKNLTSKVR